MNTQKLLFILLVVLVVLFIFGIIAGQREKGGSPPKVAISDLSASSLNSLFSAPLNLSDLSAVGGTSPQCLQVANHAFVIPANRACAFEIAQSAMPTRKLQLHLATAGVTVDVALTQNNAKTLDSVQHLPGEDPITLSVFNPDKDNPPATLSLVCRASPAKDCRVVVQ